MSIVTAMETQAIDDNGPAITRLVEGMPTIQKANANLDYILGGLAGLVMLNIAILILVYKKK